MLEISFNEKCQYLFYLIDKIDTFWNRLYVSVASVIVAIVGKELLNLNLYVSLLLIAVFVVYWIGNLCDHIGACRILPVFLQEIMIDIQKLDDKSLSSNGRKSLLKYLKKLPYKSELYRCIIAYIFSFLVLLVLFVNSYVYRFL